MSQEPLSVAFPAVGVFMDNSVAPFTGAARSGGVSFLHSASNIHVHERACKTRTKWVELTLTMAPAIWAGLNTQGVIPYDPRTGYTAQNKTTGNPGMVESAGGYLFRITPSGRTFMVEDISSGIQGRETMRLAWMCQAASYVIRTDEVSPTQVWDGTFTSNSTGYNIDAPESSKLPNFAGPVAYGDRVWIVVNGNEIIAGDHLHRTNPIGNDDLLNTTDQTYDFTSTSFPAPVDMGDILAMFIVTSSRGGNLAAQAEIVTGTEGPGMWGVLAGTPRTQWATTSMRRVIHRNSGPVGPYAGWASNNELIFRTQQGITSIKYVDNETSQVGNPYINLGQEIKPLLDKDPQDLLLFTSLHVAQSQQRLACTVWPVIDGAHRWSRGYVTAALAPGRTRMPEAMVWEGVSTLPAAMGEIIQFCEVRSVGNRRMMAIIRKPDGTKGLAEWTGDEGDDILADGTRVPIAWQLLTRKLARAGEYAVSGWANLYLSLKDIRQEVSVEILVRNRIDAPFDLIYAATFTNETWLEASGKANADSIPLAGILTKYGNKTWIELIIRGKGNCTVDVALGSNSAGAPLGAPAGQITCLTGETLCQFDIFNRS